MGGLKKHKHLIQDVRPPGWDLDCRCKSVTYFTAKCGVQSVYGKLHWRTWGVHKETELCWKLLLYLQLNQNYLLQSTPLHSWYTDPNVFSSSGTRLGTCFAEWREGPVSNFLLSPLPSEISDLLMTISTSRTRKIPQGPYLKSRAAGGQQSSHVSSKIHRWGVTREQVHCHGATSRCCLSTPQGSSFALPPSNASELLGRTRYWLFHHVEHFYESQQALSQHDRRPLTWKAVQIWGRLRWKFCPVWNAGTTRDMVYGSNNPLHTPVATSEKSP